MHTIMVVTGGFTLLAACLGIGRALGGAGSYATAALAFIPIWLAAAAVNMWIGVSRAGYTVAQEAPIFLVVFGIPAVAALILWRRFSRR